MSEIEELKQRVDTLENNLSVVIVLIFALVNQTKNSKNNQGGILQNILGALV